MSHNINITPYMCQIIYMEMRRFETKEIDSSELILRMNLMDLKKFSGIEDELTDKEVVTTALYEVVQLDKELNTTPYEMIKYLKGESGGIIKTDKILRANGESRMEMILRNKNIIESSIITYVFNTLTGRYMDRQKMDKNNLKEEILLKAKREIAPAVGNFFIEINKELDTIKDILVKQKEVKEEADLDLIFKNIELIKQSLQSGELRGTENIDKELNDIMRELTEVAKLAKTEKELSIEVTEGIQKNLNHQTRYVQYIKQKLQENIDGLEDVKTAHSESNKLIEKAEEDIENKLVKLQKISEGIQEELMDIDLTDLIRGLNQIINSQEYLEGNLNIYKDRLSAVYKNISNVIENVDNVKDVLQTFNDLIESDLITQVNAGSRKTREMVEELNDFSQKYLKMRGEFKC